VAPGTVRRPTAAYAERRFSVSTCVLQCIPRCRPERTPERGRRRKHATVARGRDERRCGCSGPREQSISRRRTRVRGGLRAPGRRPGANGRRRRNSSPTTATPATRSASRSRLTARQPSSAPAGTRPQPAMTRDRRTSSSGATTRGYRQRNSSPTTATPATRSAIRWRSTGRRPSSVPSGTRTRTATRRGRRTSSSGTTTRGRSRGNSSPTTATPGTGSAIRWRSTGRRPSSVHPKTRTRTATTRAWRTSSSGRVARGRRRGNSLPTTETPGTGSAIRWR